MYRALYFSVRMRCNDSIITHGTSIEEEKEDIRVHECTRVQAAMQLVLRKERVFACAKVSGLRITKGFNEYLEYSTLVWHKTAFVSETTWRICRYHQTSKEGGLMYAWIHPSPFDVFFFSSRFPHLCRTSIPSSFLSLDLHKIYLNRESI